MHRSDVLSASHPDIGTLQSTVGVVLSAIETATIHHPARSSIMDQIFLFHFEVCLGYPIAAYTLTERRGSHVVWRDLCWPLRSRDLTSHVHTPLKDPEHDKSSV